MFFKTNTVSILLLLIIVVVFAGLGHANMMRSSVKPLFEGMEDGEDDGEPTPPECVGADIPDCHAVVVEDDIYDYDSKYMLKTEMLPSICPPYPSLIDGHSHNKKVSEDDAMIIEKVNNASIEETNTSIEETNINNSSSSNVTNISNVTNEENVINNGMNPFMSPNGGQAEKKVNNDVENTNVSASADSCPPCPACERCPEPAFTCEKVVNYRSPAASQYLPIPVLNDFSSFPSS